MTIAKYAMVTGCDHGLGLHLARELLKRKYLDYAGKELHW